MDAGQRRAGRIGIKLIVRCPYPKKFLLDAIADRLRWTYPDLHTQRRLAATAGRLHMGFGMAQCRCGDK